MIVETMVGIFLESMSMALSGLEIVGLPMQAIDALQSILCYGIWVVGADIMAIFANSVVSWWVIKFTVGAVVFVWELLPLT